MRPQVCQISALLNLRARQQGLEEEKKEEIKPQPQEIHEVPEYGYHVELELPVRVADIYKGAHRVSRCMRGFIEEVTQENIPSTQRRRVKGQTKLK